MFLWHRKFIAGKKGTALAVALTFCIILAIGAGAIMMFGRSQYGTLIRGTHRIERRHAAEAGLQRALWRLSNMPDAAPGVPVGFYWGNSPLTETITVGSYSATITMTYVVADDNYDIQVSVP